MECGLERHSFAYGYDGRHTCKILAWLGCCDGIECDEGERLERLRRWNGENENE